MPFYFEPFPTVLYDIKKNGKKVELTNLFLRYKIVEAFKNQKATYYNYNIKEGERPDTIAFKYYGDASLDWIILLTNNIIDPQFEWPLDKRSFQRFLVKKYGNISTAYSTTHHYEQIIQNQKVLFDGTIIPERVAEIDLVTYNSLSSSSKRLVTAYEYEERLNESKREIKLLSDVYLFDLLSIVSEAFQQ